MTSRPFVALGLAAMLLGGLGCSAAASTPAGEGTGGGGGIPEGTGGSSGAPAPFGPPWIFSGELVNARDVGGLVAGDAQVKAGMLFRGPPLRLSAAGCEEFAALGIRTVVDLRIGSEQTQPPACVTSLARLVLAPLPIPYSVSPADYVAIVGAEASVAQVFHALGDPAAYPVYAHCTWGRDRTGVLFGLILLALGVSRDAIVQEYLLSDDTVGAFPLSLEAALDEVERRGGIGPYLTGIGVTEAELATLRGRTVEPLPAP